MNKRVFRRFCLTLLMLSLLAGCAIAGKQALRGSGDLGIIIERAIGKVLIVETSSQQVLAEVEGLGNLAHASAVYSRDARYAYVFGREGGLSKVDLLSGTLVKRIVQSGNSIGGAISQDGRLIAVSNYDPGGVRVFDAETLELVADIPASYGEHGELSKVIGLVDAPGQRFVFGLWDAGEIWVADMHEPARPKITKFRNVGKFPYDALITPDGRYYMAGLFGEDGLVRLDLWNLDAGVERVMPGYGKGEKALPVYKMPHLEGWASAGDQMLLPAIGRHEVLIVDRKNWQEAGRVAVHGQPIFVMARPDGRQVWVNFAFPHNDTIQVIDVPTQRVIKTLKPGKAVLHMEFTPRGEHVWMSVRDEDRVDIYDTETFRKLRSIPADKPSGIFFTSRAHKIGL